MQKWLLIWASFWAGFAVAEPLGTAFTYQGELKQNGQLANGDFDLRFDLYDVAAEGSPIATPVVLNDVPVVRGIFSVEIDFGIMPFAGDQLWLEIGVREGSSAGGYEPLLPRDKLTAQPYALHAEMVALGAVGSAEVNPGQVQLRISESCAPGNMIRSIEEDGTVLCAPDNNTTYEAGTGLLLDQQGFSVNPAEVQSRVSGGCSAGSSIREISESGAVLCQPDQDTTYTAGTGLELTGSAFATDPTQVQTRIAGTCAAGSYVREVAQDGSVLCETVSPVGSPVQNVVVVAKNGGDFTTISSALSSITDASASNPYQIFVGPGVYEERVLMTPFVDLVGSGRNTTKVLFPAGNGGLSTVRAADNSEIRSLTVENDGSGTNSFAIAVELAGVEARLTDIIAVATGSSFNYAVYAASESTVDLSNSKISAAEGSSAVAVYLFTSYAVISNSELEANDDTNANGVYTTHSGTAPQTLHVLDSTIRATNTTLRVSSAYTVLIANSELGGGGIINNVGGSITCAYSRDDSFAALTSSCTP